MRRPVLLVTILLAITAIVFVAGASASPKSTTTTSTTTSSTSTLPLDSGASGPGSHYFVLNGTADAASDHEIAGSSAFPNFRNGAVDNYYSMSHAHVDNAPFAEGTASPADTGPIGQTAAAGNFQQPQYADARWPGDSNSGKATYGTQGQPYASAVAREYYARAEASEASQGLSGGPSMTMAGPKGFDGKLRAALAAWKAKWQDRLSPKRPVGSGTRTITTPTATVPTPIGTITAPAVTVPGLNTPPPPVTVPLPPVPRTAARDNTTQSRSLASTPVTPSAPSPGPADGASQLDSKAGTTLDSATGALITNADSRVGRVTLGGGQIVIEGIYVTARIVNDGTPSYKVVVDVANATIGGVPVTIDQDGVHVQGQSGGVPYQQASDSLNSALKQAGIQLFLVAPEITRASNSCDQSGNGPGTGGGNGSTNSSDQSDSTNSCDQSNSCDSTGTGSGTGNGSTTTTTSSNPSPLTPTTTTNSNSSSCDQSQSSSCQTSASNGTGKGSTTTTSSTPSPLTPTTTTTSTTTSSHQTSTTTTTTTSSCDQSGTTSGSCSSTGATPTTTSSSDYTGSTTTNSSDQTGGMGASTSSGELSITATGLHVVFTQPDGAPSGVPAQNAEHILGEVFLDSLAVPAVPLKLAPISFGGGSSSLSSSSPSSSSSSSSCLGGVAGGSKSSGGLLASGSSSSGSPSGFTSGSSSQLGSSATGSPVGNLAASFTKMLRKKPLWVLVAFLVWQALAVGTGTSLWHWRKGGAA